MRNEGELITLAESGNIIAMYQLICRYDNGYEMKKDKKQAFNWCIKAAIAGSKECLFELIDRYKKGLGVKKNIEKAKRLENLVNLGTSRYEIKKKIEEIINSVDITISIPETLYKELNFLAENQSKTISELIDEKFKN